ncbi:MULTISPECIES: hypothetical protein [Nostocaceae]|nr:MULTISPECIES: hypothetical protein [Nostocaceae]MBD2267141.1 hypothetical protein [Anabaena sp. FACHB-709]MBD2276693.1 hypothetical protein [Nostoc sp. PCC 7120 = FACHB-418]MBD2287303.1 hypothetical protein [Anabaena cylindrica FACHB-170]MBD2352951.1 hypothetical protein [Trichormus variabilis FACHB-171]
MTISPANTPFSICVTKINHLFTFTRQRSHLTRSPYKNLGTFAATSQIC